MNDRIEVYKSQDGYRFTRKSGGNWKVISASTEAYSSLRAVKANIVKKEKPGFDINYSGQMFAAGPEVDAFLNITGNVPEVPAEPEPMPAPVPIHVTVDPDVYTPAEPSYDA